MNHTDQAVQQPLRILFPIFHLGLLCWLACVSAGTVSGQQQPTGRGSVSDSTDNGVTSGFEGGSAQADFDSLIDLIQSTVDADTWVDNGTGEGEISPFAINGVFVDASGTLRFTQASLDKGLSQNRLGLGRGTGTYLLRGLRKNEPVPDGSDKQTEHIAGDVRRTSSLRFVSLPRLEAAILRRQMAHQPLLPEMLTLAGLERVEYVLVDPERGDLLLAGPAGDWQVESNGRIVSTQTGQPVVRLDDFLTLWRRQQTHSAAQFGCSIIPRQEALAKTQAYIKATSGEPIEPNGRGDWLRGLRESLGKQDVEFFGISAANHVSQVLLTADYHMKLIGMGIADGSVGTTDGVESYLSTVRLMPDGNPPPMSVLRWWFTMHYEPVEVSADRNVFRLNGQGVKVLSENELLAARGQRVHTGQSDELNQRFVDSFTEHFEALSTAYPLYGELRGVFDLSLILAIIEREGLMERVGWQAALFSSANALRLPRVAVPREVETVVNHRVINRRLIVAGVSGGVWVNARKSLHIRAAATGQTVTMVPSEPPVSADLWWWDENQ